MSLDVNTAATVGGTFVGSGVTMVGFVRWVVPWNQRRKAAKAAARDIEQAKNEVLLGRPAIPANPITGEDERPAIPGLGDRLQAMDSKQEFLIGQVHAAQETQKTLAVIQDQLGEITGRLGHVETDVADLKAGHGA